MENNVEQPLQFLTLQQTAEALQLSTRTLLRMLKHKKLPAVKVGGQWRVHTSELIKWARGLGEQ